MLPSSDAIALARTARRTALVAIDHPDLPVGLLATGADVRSFLHSQLTNDVTGLASGAGQHTARVARTGHLEHSLSLHVLSDDDGILLLCEPDRAHVLAEDLDAYLFSDDVTFTPWTPHWLAIQGPSAADIADALFGPLGFEPWSALPEGSVRAVRRARKTVAAEPLQGAWAVRRSLTGDTGFLVALPDAAAVDAVRAALPDILAAHDAAFAAGDAASQALDILRIEAGWVRHATDLAPKRRLLPETGIEQVAVSYTKGCYIGQEVIARVRTYGSVPHLMRTLLLEPRDTAPDGAAATLSSLPAPGTMLHDAESGKRVGAITSRTWSPVAGGPIAYAFLQRDHRAPGRVLNLVCDTGAWTATVSLAPLYRAPDLAQRVAWLYDRAIRTFADGDADAALALLEDALKGDPSYADAYEAIGVILGKSGRYHEAIDFFRRLEEVAPEEPMVHTNLSLYYMKLGDRETAEIEAARATTKNMAKMRGKQRSAAELEAETVRSRQRDAERKRGMFARVLEIDDADPIALFGMGNALLVLEDFEAAHGHLERAVAADPQNSAVYAAWGKALERLDRTAEAIDTYRRGIEVASRKGDLMPLREMEHRLLLLSASQAG